MDKVSSIEGVAAAFLQPNVDTDAMIRVDRLMEFEAGALGPYLFENLRYTTGATRAQTDFVLNQPRARGARILLAGENFGCGSSREAAVWSLMDFGFRCIIAPSFGDIFFANSLQNGLLPIVLPAGDISALAADLSAAAVPSMRIDLKDLIIESAAGVLRGFEFDVEQRAALLEGLDEIGVTMKNGDAIAQFERADKQAHPWIYSDKPATRIVSLAGDGIGREIMEQSKRVIAWFKEHRGVKIEVQEELYGIDAWKAHGELMRKETWEAIRSADAILFGATGSPEYASIPSHHWLPDNLLRIRKELDLFCNLRPVRMSRQLTEMSTLRPEVIEGADLLIVRELGGGLYFSDPRGVEELPQGGRRGFNTMAYTSQEIERIAHSAFQLARGRHGRVCSVDKANVLEVSMLWREVVQAVRDREYPDVVLEHMYVDNAAMQLVRAPRQFDVMLTENLFGDILSDCAAMITGSIGMLPSASLGPPDAQGRRRALYEPIHGSAPDIAGKGIANPVGCIMSFGLCMQFSMGLAQEARLLQRAVDAAIESGARTADIAHGGLPAISTEQMGSAVITALNVLSDYEEIA
jgi:3-isopropylmalate dehydrogenase